MKMVECACDHCDGVFYGVSFMKMVECACESL